jgi:hypothetical protein
MLASFFFYTGRHWSLLHCWDKIRGESVFSFFFPGKKRACLLPAKIHRISPGTPVALPVLQNHFIFSARGTGTVMTVAATAAPSS